MLKIVATVTKNNFLRNNFTRYFANYRDTGEYHFLDKLNYVGNRGIFWTHPQSTFIIRVTDDYDQCCRGNLSIDDNTCWWYFPKKILSMMENGFNEQDVLDIEKELRSWKLIQTAPKNYFEWSVSLARIYATYPNVPREQKYFATKQYASTFYTDDSIEKLNSKREFNSAAEELITNLNSAFNGKFDQITDMNKFKEQDNIPSSYIENAIRAINIQIEISQLAKQLLKPKIHDLFVLGCHDYLSGVTAERALFQKHFSSKTNISEEEGKSARKRSIGLRWIIATTLTDVNTSFYLGLPSPAVDLGGLIAINENDLIGCFRDKHVDFSPMTFFQPNVSGKSEVEVAKIFADKINQRKKVLLHMWDNIRPDNSNHYEHIARYVGLLTDYHFVSGLRKANSRYGWIPQLD